MLLRLLATKTDGDRAALVIVGLAMAMALGGSHSAKVAAVVNGLLGFQVLCAYLQIMGNGHRFYKDDF